MPVERKSGKEGKTDIVEYSVSDEGREAALAGAALSCGAYALANGAPLTGAFFLGGGAMAITCSAIRRMLENSQS
jgi:hypothetical protein